MTKTCEFVKKTSQSVLKIAVCKLATSVVDPHWFQCGSGSSFFYLNADPDSDLEPGFQTNADPGGSGFGLDFWVTKDEFLHEKYTKK